MLILFFVFRRMLLIIGGCADSSEENCQKSCEMGLGIAESFQIDRSASFNECRRAPVMFRSDDQIFVVGGCSAPNVHLKSIEVANVNEKPLNWKRIPETFDEGFSCASFCQLEAFIHTFNQRIKFQISEWRLLYCRWLQWTRMPEFGLCPRQNCKHTKIEVSSNKTEKWNGRVDYAK